MSATAEIVRNALTVLARGVECGCSPCRGACRSAEALLAEIESRCDIASEALAALDAASAPARAGDSDAFTRITRDIARSA